jgi:Fe-Mn family superoxide dismutase
MPTRRQAIKTLAAAALATTALGRLPVIGEVTMAQAPAANPPEPTGPFKLPPLPYAYDALEPAIDAETMHLHHDKHHAGYVKKLNEAIAKDPAFVPGTTVEDLIAHLDSVPEDIRTAVRNNGGGHANHSLFWQTLSPKGGEPSGALAAALTADLGGLDKVKEAMSKEGGAVFGSGWVWLVVDGGKKLDIMKTPNQDSPLIEGHFPLFGIDVWEHAYYLKYHNVRADYLKAIWSVTNWPFISERYTKAMA